MRPQTHDHNSVNFWPIYNFFFIERSVGKLTVKWSLYIPSLLAYVATLPCESLMSDNKWLTIKYNAWYGEVVNNQIKKGLSPSQSVIFFNRWIFCKVTSKSVVVSCTFFIFNNALERAHKVQETTTFLRVNIPRNLPVKKLGKSVKTVIFFSNASTRSGVFLARF